MVCRADGFAVANVLWGVSPGQIAGVGVVRREGLLVVAPATVALDNLSIDLWATSEVSTASEDIRSPESSRQYGMATTVSHLN
jgi:hypothetical protein